MFRQVPRTHPVHRKRKGVSHAIILFLLLGTVLSEYLAFTYFQTLFIQTDKNLHFCTVGFVRVKLCDGIWADEGTPQ
jgi:polyferredoxin